ncbi:MAG: HAMP domain-containing histidine kinase [Alcanivorax sp.]|nr:HAMP domain-containing histidine kinase [Alcanivorax sp.]MAY10590.1 HAMP domain-containing histidine kinase [Alcanivorax sp.]MBU57963.1 HAMP domain-containing histidine kinase [Alcanivorax sp.]HCE40668.1 HAMP domain-containing histidine kinase [Alcanivorax sp.]|tara:strand:+ start:62265 stop:63611 length:1347 start_codon:yes stop_codon:yes gene_type:complete
MPGRGSLFWKLALLLSLSAVITVGLSWTLTRHVGNRVLLLDEEARTVMRGYAAEAWRAWDSGGEAGVAAWLDALAEREPGDAMVVNADDVSLSGRPLTDAQRAGLRFQRKLDWRMSFRMTAMPYIGVPFPQAPEAGSLVMQLPPRYFPGGSWPYWKTFLLVVMPALLALLAGALLYWRIMVPLRQLQARVRRFQDDPAARVEAELAHRGDEFGELGRRFNRMAERVAGMLDTQRRLLHDLSHELRTPLSRLTVALEGDLSEAELRRRVARELTAMRTLVGDTLSLAWHDTEQSRAATEALSPASVWDLVAENAAFESDWSQARFPCRVPASARVRGNLNDLAQALENLVRNAVRHSPPEGRVTLDGRREGDVWHLWVADEGPGVPDERLEAIFEPFVRLDRARSADHGFGLGLSIARRAVARQGGTLWADNEGAGLRVHLRLPAEPDV